VRTLATAALHGAAVTLAVLAALRASDPVLAVAAVAVVVVVLTWFAALASDDSGSGLDVTGSLQGLVLAIVGRTAWGSVLPVLATQAVVGVAIGAGADALHDQLGPTLVVGTPSLALAGVVAALVGVLAAWVTLAVDGSAPVALVAAPVAVAGGAGPVVLVGAFHPATVLALGTAGLLAWDVVAIVVATATLGAVIGSYTVSTLLPAAGTEDEPA